jgi:hypothetical protein
MTFSSKVVERNRLAVAMRTHDGVRSMGCSRGGPMFS